MRYIPVLLLTLLLTLFWWGLKNDPHHVPSEFIGKPVPDFQGTTLFDSKTVDQTLFKGHIRLLNIWTTTCLSCLSEHALLLDLAKHGVQLIGLNKGDSPEIARQWISQQGNPYHQIMMDPQGKLSTLLGVLGTPETFLIDAKGLIRYRHTGILTPEVWQAEFVPRIKILQEKRQ